MLINLSIIGQLYPDMSQYQVTVTFPIAYDL